MENKCQLCKRYDSRFLDISVVFLLEKRHRGFHSLDLGGQKLRLSASSSSNAFDAMKQRMPTPTEPQKIKNWSNVPSGTKIATIAAMAATIFSAFRIIRFNTFNTMELYHRGNLNAQIKMPTRDPRFMGKKEPCTVEPQKGLTH